jgi:hypothetical protein
MIANRGQVRALGGRQQQPHIWSRALTAGTVALVYGSASGYTLAITDAISQPEIASVRRHMMETHAVRGLAWCCEARCVDAAGLLHPREDDRDEALEAG